MSTLRIVRGLPGSGKSTFAKEYLSGESNMVHLEADMYHVNTNGDYDWHAENLKKSHEWCFESTKIFLNNGIEVVVSNTFTTHKEMKPYIDFCKNKYHKLIVYRRVNYYGNIHNVPPEVIQKMSERFEGYEGEKIV